MITFLLLYFAAASENALKVKKQFTDTKIWTLLLEFKAEVDQLNDKGTTSLQLTIIQETSSCVKTLLDHNANINIQKGFLLRYAVIKSNHSYC